MQSIRNRGYYATKAAGIAAVLGRWLTIATLFYFALAAIAWVLRYRKRPGS